MNSIKKFKENFEKSMNTIEMFLDEPSEIQVLVNWMVETDINPYSYLPETWAGALSSADSFASLLHHIHHAVYDDGDITFIKVDNEPRITFFSKHEEDFDNLVLTKIEQERQLRTGCKIEVEVLDIKPNEFPSVYEEYHAAYIKRCFMLDANGDIDWAVKHYAEYQCFNSDWIAEAKEKYKNVQ